MSSLCSLLCAYNSRRELSATCSSHQACHSLSHFLAVEALRLTGKCDPKQTLPSRRCLVMVIFTATESGRSKKMAWLSLCFALLCGRRGVGDLFLPFPGAHPFPDDWVNAENKFLFGRTQPLCFCLSTNSKENELCINKHLSQKGSHYNTLKTQSQ